jgi:hypothetical protein
MIYIEYYSQPVTSLSINITCWFASDHIVIPQHTITLSISALAFSIIKSADHMLAHVRSSMLSKWHDVYKLLHKQAVLQGLENGCDFYHAERIPKTLPVDIEVRERKLYGT